MRMIHGQNVDCTRTTCIFTIAHCTVVSLLCHRLPQCWWSNIISCLVWNCNTNPRSTWIKPATSLCTASLVWFENRQTLCDPCTQSIISKTGAQLPPELTQHVPTSFLLLYQAPTHPHYIPSYWLGGMEELTVWGRVLNEPRKLAFLCWAIIVEP